MEGFSNNIITTREIGQLTEAIALTYLQQRELVLVETNVHSRCGEIDIVMKEKGTWVFVEVKYRKNNTFGGAISAISSNKQRKIKLSAAFFLQQQGLNEYNTPCRFDVLALDGNITDPTITWLQNAF